MHVVDCACIDVTFGNVGVGSSLQRGEHIYYFLRNLIGREKNKIYIWKDADIKSACNACREVAFVRTVS